MLIDDEARVETRTRDSDSALLTISIVSHGQREIVGDLLADLAHLQPVGVGKLILTLNRPEELPAGIDALPFEVQVLRNERARGFGTNHNRAFKHCTTPWFAIFNPDLHLVSDFLVTSLRALDPADALLSPRVLELGGAPADATRRLLTPWQLVRRVLGIRNPAEPDEADWIAGMCVLVRSSAFAAVGGFDERFYLYLEDADLSLRLQLAGWRIRQIESAAVIHAGQRASHHSFRHLRWHMSSLLKHWMSSAFWRYYLTRHRLNR
jgi:N-acetylglucosaminyl-diphospho-decaprenol L-rhamnosyltransferase